MASAAPFGGLGPHNVLHVFNAFSVPLIVERRKMMDRAIPLVVDVGVATLAAIGFHEELAGYMSAVDHLRRTREERAFWAIAFGVHGLGSDRRVPDDVGCQPASFTQCPS